MTLQEQLNEYRRQIIIKSLIENKFNQCRAARELGVHRNTVSRSLDELDINLRELKVQLGGK